MTLTVVRADVKIQMEKVLTKSQCRIELLKNGVSMLMIVMERLKVKTEAMLQIIMKNLTIRTRSVENTIRTAKAFTMQAETTKHLQDLKSRSVSRKNRRTSWEVVLVHLLQHAFL